MGSVMRAKMQVTSVIPAEGSELIHFSAVTKYDGYDENGTDENNTFARWTPSADLTMDIRNPELFGKLPMGKQFYLDFTEVS